MNSQLNTATRKAFLINSINDLASDYWANQEPETVTGRLVHVAVKEWQYLTSRQKLSLTLAQLASIVSFLSCIRKVER